MAFNKQEMTALIQLDPSKAKKRILDAYKQANCSVKDAADILGCGERTLHRWIAQLFLGEQIADMKKKALKEGWHHTNSRHGGRPPAQA